MTDDVAAEPGTIQTDEKGNVVVGAPPATSIARPADDEEEVSG